MSAIEDEIRRRRDEQAHLAEHPACDDLAAHQQRVIAEAATREAEAQALADFIEHSPIYPTLAPHERDLMQVQLSTMASLVLILRQRIALF